MRRRDFLKSIGIGATSLALTGFLYEKAKSSHRAKANKPNILFIITDQQSLKAMSDSNGPYIKTTAMDSIAANGVRFENSYCTSPVCSPSRSSLLTSRMPHETGVNYNNMTIDPAIANMGRIFRQAGYETVYTGKWHLPGVFQDNTPGFKTLPFECEGTTRYGDNTDGPIADEAVKFIKSKHNQPFLLVVSLQNPHDVCHCISSGKKCAKPPNISSAPLLPVNFAVDPNEPELLKKRRQQTYYGGQLRYTKDWDENDWRTYLYSYYRLIEHVDAEVGKVLNALRQAGLEEDTLIIFTSDHGEGMAAHKWVVKLCLYEEPATVPLIVSFKAVTPAGVVDKGHLVSGLDVLPTMCDYAGIKAPGNIRGESLRDIIEKPNSKGHDFVVTELAPDTMNHDFKARMLRTSRYKYIAFSHGKNNEQLFDLKNDPGETKNLARDSSMKTVLNGHRNLLSRWVTETNDNFCVPG